MFLSGLSWVSIALAFDIEGVEAKWQDGMLLEDIPTAPPCTLEGMSIAPPRAANTVHLSSFGATLSGAPFTPTCLERPGGDLCPGRAGRDATSGGESRLERQYREGRASWLATEDIREVL